MFSSINFTADGTSGFTVANDGVVIGPWAYPRPISRFELHADSPLAADRYAADPQGSVIDLNNANLEVVVLSGTLDVGDSFSLFDLSMGTTLTGTYGSLSLPGGTWDRSNLTVDGTITLLALPGLVEESFDYTAGHNVGGKAGGNGFSAPWEISKDTNLIDSGSLYWGALRWSGNRMSPTAWAAVERSMGTTLANAGLMADGATLWFSYVVDTKDQNMTNLDHNFALCSDGFYWTGDVNASYPDRTNLTTGEGIGVGGGGGGQIQGAYWQNNDADAIAERTTTNTSLVLNATTKSRALIVGKIVWGASAGDPETITLYAPGPDLVPGAPILDSWATPALDQSLLNRVGIEWKDNETAIDEIRFGASYAEVTPLDVIAPTATAFSPADNTTDVEGYTNLTVTFDEPIMIGTGDIVIKNLTTPARSETITLPDARVSLNGFVVTIDPAAFLDPGSNYVIRIANTAVTDPAGNPYKGIANDIAWSFTTKATDTTGPVIAVTIPADDATGVAVAANLVVTFDERIQRGTGNITLKNLTASTSQAINVTDTNQVFIDEVAGTLTIAPHLSPAAGANYAIQIANGAIKDLYGNAFLGLEDPDVTTWNFTTDTLAIGAQQFTIHPPDPQTPTPIASVGNDLLATNLLEITRDNGDTFAQPLWHNGRTDNGSLTAYDVTDGHGENGVEIHFDVSTNTAGYHIDEIRIFTAGTGLDGVYSKVGQSIKVYYQAVANAGSHDNATFIQLGTILADPAGGSSPGGILLSRTYNASGHLASGVSAILLATNEVKGSNSGATLNWTRNRVQEIDVIGTAIGTGTPYENWTVGPFQGTLTDSNAALDFDHGGLPTGIEWVVGGDPTKGSDDTGLAPTFDNTTDGEYFIFTYRRSDAANTDTNTTIAVEYGSNLTGWTTAVHDGTNIIITPTDEGGGTGIDLVQVKIKRTLATGSKLFARLKVVLTP